MLRFNADAILFFYNEEKLFQKYRITDNTGHVNWTVYLFLSDAMPFLLLIVYGTLCAFKNASFRTPNAHVVTILILATTMTDSADPFPIFPMVTNQCPYLFTHKRNSAVFPLRPYSRNIVPTLWKIGPKDFFENVWKDAFFLWNKPIFNLISWACRKDSSKLSGKMLTNWLKSKSLSGNTGIKNLYLGH